MAHQVTLSSGIKVYSLIDGGFENFLKEEMGIEILEKTDNAVFEKRNDGWFCVIYRGKVNWFTPKQYGKAFLEYTLNK